MAAINNLFASTKALSLSIQAFRNQSETTNSFRPGQADQLVSAVADFISGIHGKEMFISKPPVKNGSTPISGWDYKTVKGKNIQSNYFANKSSRAFQLGSVVSTNTNEWIQLQGTIYGIYSMLDPLSIVLENISSATEKTFWLENMGVILSSTTLRGADNSIIPAPPAADAYEFAQQWNTLKVPYDRNSGYDTPYVFGVETDYVFVTPTFPLRIIGNIIVDQDEAINYWDSAYSNVI